MGVAESVKYLCNVFHALKIVFANEAGAVLKEAGLDSRDVLALFCEDKQLNISRPTSAQASPSEVPACRRRSRAF